MRATKRSFLLMTVVWLAAGSSVGSDVWAFRFASSGRVCGFSYIQWYDDLIFHNTTAQDAVVRLLGMTGSGGDRTPELVVPAGKTVSLAHLSNLGIWSPQEESLWVVHLDVPEGVLVRSRAGAFSDFNSGGVPPSGTPDLGAFAMPIFHTLTPAGQTQVHLGADLGTENARINVGVFNSGDAVAAVTLEVRAGCNDAVLERRTAAVPAGAVLQISGLGAVTPNCDPGTSNFWLRYVTVTADQATLSYVSNLQNDPSCFARVPYSAISAE